MLFNEDLDDADHQLRRSRHRRMRDVFFVVLVVSWKVDRARIWMGYGPHFYFKIFQSVFRELEPRKL